MRSDLFRSLNASSKFLYICMLDTLFDSDNRYRNTSKRDVEFGPMDAKAYGYNKRTYYRSEGQLINVGVIYRFMDGGHGKRSKYDLTAWESSPYVVAKKKATCNNNP